MRFGWQIWCQFVGIPYPLYIRDYMPILFLQNDQVWIFGRQESVIHSVHHVHRIHARAYLITLDIPINTYIDLNHSLSLPNSLITK